MSRPAVIVDTNAVVAGLLTTNDASPTARILDGMLSAASSPSCCRKPCSPNTARYWYDQSCGNCKGYRSRKSRQPLPTDPMQHAIILAPVAASLAPDPGDQLLRDLLAARADLMLVTGDKQSFRDAELQECVIKPEEFATDG